MTNASFERRDSFRHARVEAHRIVWARVRPAYDASVINVSAGGALIETSQRLMPGSCVALHLRREAPDAEVIRGRVVRCSVARLGPSAVSYRGAIAFDHPLRWFTGDENDGYQVPASKNRTSAPVWADATRQST